MRVSSRACLKWVVRVCGIVERALRSRGMNVRRPEEEGWAFVRVSIRLAADFALRPVK